MIFPNSRWHVRASWSDKFGSSCWFDCVVADNIEQAFNVFTDNLWRDYRAYPPTGARVLVQHEDIVKYL